MDTTRLPLVRDVVQPPITIDPEAPIGTALATMREREIRHLPVVDDAGRLIGIVTDRDLRDAILGSTFAAYLRRAPGPASSGWRGGWETCAYAT